MGETNFKKILKDYERLSKGNVLCDWCQGAPATLVNIEGDYCARCYLTICLPAAKAIGDLLCRVTGWQVNTRSQNVWK